MRRRGKRAFKEYVWLLNGSDLNLPLYRFDSIPSTEIKKLKAGWLGGSGDYKRGQYASSSLLSARKRLEDFKSKREEKVQERGSRAFAEISEEEARTLVGLDDGKRESKEESGGRLEESRRRLEAFRKLRQERKAAWSGI